MAAAHRLLWLLFATAAIVGPTMGPYWGRQCQQALTSDFDGSSTQTVVVVGYCRHRWAHYGPILGQTMPAVWRPPLSSRWHKKLCQQVPFCVLQAYILSISSCCCCWLLPPSVGPQWAHIGADDASSVAAAILFQMASGMHCRQWGPTMGPYVSRRCQPYGCRHFSSRWHQACNWRDAWRESGSHSSRWYQARAATIGGPLWTYMVAEDASGRLEPEHAKLVCRRIAGGDGGVTRIALAAFVRHYAIV
jgi:hypothetical protein